MKRLETNDLQSHVEPGTVVVVSTGNGPFEQAMADGRHIVTAEEPRSAGGGDAGPGPYELLLMSLGSCTSMTVQLYAARKKWPLEQVIVRLRHSRKYIEDCADCEKPTAMVDHIDKSVGLVGALDDAQRARLMEIADHCPVHRTLTSKIVIKTAAM
ncbi:MAG: OsmC family protein [Alphaproteobacteria bacterium]|nr:OsmC family protein [Alphaproteobacteria bacterium]